MEGAEGWALALAVRELDMEEAWMTKRTRTYMGITRSPLL